MRSTSVKIPIYGGKLDIVLLDSWDQLKTIYPEQDVTTDYSGVFFVADKDGAYVVAV